MCPDLWSSTMCPQVQDPGGGHWEGQWDKLWASSWDCYKGPQHSPNICQVCAGWHCVVSGWSLHELASTSSIHIDDMKILFRNPIFLLQLIIISHDFNASIRQIGTWDFTELLFCSIIPKTSHWRWINGNDDHLMWYVSFLYLSYHII